MKKLFVFYSIFLFAWGYGLGKGNLPIGSAFLIFYAQAFVSGLTLSSFYVTFSVKLGFLLEDSRGRLSFLSSSFRLWFNNLVFRPSTVIPIVLPVVESDNSTFMEDLPTDEIPLKPIKEVTKAKDISSKPVCDFCNNERVSLGGEAIPCPKCNSKKGVRSKNKSKIS